MELRDYQEEISNKAVDLLRKYRMVYLSMEVRTGKTITALAACRKLNLSRVLFVTKKKAISSIEGDAKLFPGIEVVVINYESVHKVDFKPQLIVCDEAHSMGAFAKPSKRAKTMKQISFGLPIIYLSGTPTPESYSQIYHQFWISSFTPFQQYANFYKWAKDFVNLKKRYMYNREVNDYSDAKKDLIDKYTKHLFISKTQEDAGFKVEIEERVLDIPISPKATALANKLIKDRIYEGKSGQVILADTAVKLQGKLHQIYSGSVKDEDNNIIIIDYSKGLYIREYFKGRKIAIFYKYIGELQALQLIFKNNTSDSVEFQNSDDKVYLGQFASSREGIRLDTADAIIFYNIDFSFLSYEQGKNRIVSKERTKQAILYWAFSVGGIERKIYNVVKNKSNFTTSYFCKEYNLY